MATLAELLVNVGLSGDDLESGMERVGSAVEDNFAKISAAGVAAGVGLEAFARKQAPLNEQLRQTAAAAGINEDAMRDLALETSNVTFPMEDVLGLMESGRQQGLETGQELQRFATFWDTVGDATGESATELGKAGVALRAVGIEAGNEGEALDALGFITENTTGSVTDFLSFIERTGPELREMNLDVDDAAAIMGVLENELGMTGRTARQEFRTAVNEAEGDLGVMLETLGISEEQFDSYGQAVEGSSDVIQRNADIHAESFTPLQRLQHAAEELMFRFGGLADVAGALAVPMLALGPVSKLVVTGIRSIGPAAAFAGRAFGLMGVAAGRAAAATAAAASRFLVSAARMTAAMAATAARVVAGWVLMGAQALAQAARMAAAWLIALGPIGIVIAAVVALAVLIIANWDRISSATSRLMRAVGSFLRSGWNAAVRFVRNALTVMRVVLVSRFNNMMAFVRSIPGRIARGLGNLGGLLVGAGSALISGFVRGIQNAAGRAIQAARNVVSRVRNLLPFSPAKEGPLAGTGAPDRAGRIFGEMFAGGIEDAEAAVVDAAEQMTRAAAMDPAMAARSATGVGRVHREPVVLQISGDGTGRAEFLVEELRRSVDQRGGDVQVVLGRRRP